MGMRSGSTSLFAGPRSCRGLSLVETLVAMAVFGLSLLTLMPLSVATLRVSDLAATRVHAVALAQTKLEDFRLLPYEQMAVLATGQESLPDGYVRQWGIVDAPTQPGDGNDLVRLWVKVSWNSTSPGAVSLVDSRSRY